MRRSNLLIRNSWRLCSLLLAVAATPLTAAPPADFEQSKRQFVERMVEKHGFDRSYLLQLLAQANYRQKIIDAITRPAEAKPWYRYRPIFVTEQRAREGAEFWRQNRELLERAQKEYGVPASMIIAIIGIETRYGRHTGDYPVLDALSTLGFGYPRRGAFFQKELEQFLLLTREEQVDPLSAVGSYAGALGKPQFIPSSYRSYAVDFDGDKRRDLWRSNADVIGSIAAYFQRHGWRTGAPVAVPAEGVTARHKPLLAAGSKPSLSPQQLAKAGITPTLPTDAGPLSLIELDGPDGKEYWIGFNNFYVITRYNHSNLYAMSALQLAQMIERIYRAKETLARD